MDFEKIVYFIDNLPHNENLEADVRAIKKKNLEIKVNFYPTSTKRKVAIELYGYETKLQILVNKEPSKESFQDVINYACLYFNRAKDIEENAVIQGNLEVIIDYFIKYDLYEKLAIFIRECDVLSAKPCISQSKIKQVFDIFLFIRRDFSSIFSLDNTERNWFDVNQGNDAFSIIREILCLDMVDIKSHSCGSSMTLNVQNNIDKSLVGEYQNLIDSNFKDFAIFIRWYENCINKYHQAEEESKKRKIFLLLLVVVNQFFDSFMKNADVDYGFDSIENNLSENFYKFYCLNFKGIHESILRYTKDLLTHNWFNYSAALYVINRLLCLENMTEQVKYLLRYEKNNTDDRKLYYYTSLNSLRRMLPECCKNDTSKEYNTCLGNFKLMHIAYMNDPQEGNVLLNHLGILYNPFLAPPDDYYLDNVPYVFIKCFSSHRDSLPMWKMYGDGCSGCCLEISWGNNQDTLYSVCYMDTSNRCVNAEDNANISVDKIDKLNHLIEEIGSLVDDLRDFLNDCNNYDGIIDQFNTIRYLFKDAAYSYEKEYRCLMNLQDDTSSIELLGPKDSIPKLGVNCTDSFTISSIILGPKISNITEILPYLQYQLELLAKAKGYEIPLIYESSIMYQ